MVAFSPQVTYQLHVQSVQIKRHNKAHDKTCCNRDNHSKHNRAVLKQHIKLWEYTLEVDRMGWNIQFGAQSTKDRALKHNILVSGYLRYLLIVNIKCDPIVAGSAFSKHIHKRQPISILWGTSHGQMAVLGIAADHCDNPCKFVNHTCVSGPELLLRPVKLIWNTKKCWFHIMILFIN